MKLILTPAGLFLIFLADLPAAPDPLPGPEQPRVTLPLNHGWAFQPAKPLSLPQADAKAAELTASPSGVWHPIAVPQFLNRIVWWLRDLSDEYEVQEQARMGALPFDATNTLAGWYRREIVIPASPEPAPEVVLSFEGVAMSSRVYCNGHPVGGHVGMFGTFHCRLTPHLVPGKPNSILVYVERGADVKGGDEVAGIAVTVPVTRSMLTSLNRGVFGSFGRGADAKFMGIWQPVTLTLSRAGARVQDAFFNPRLDRHTLEITVHNPSAEPVTGSLRYTLKDRASGKVFFSATLPEALSLSPGATRTVTHASSGLRPKLWSPASPNLYDLAIDLLDASGQPVDRWTHAVGYRTVEIKGTRVYLNGHPWWVRSANMPPYGYRPNCEDTARGFLKLMREGNTPVTRSHCNPWNEMWFTAADEIGVGVVLEGVRPWALMSETPPPPKPILEHWKQETVETLLRYRNHPSILFYCVANEGLQSDHENPTKLAIFKDLIDTMRALDSSRPLFQTSGDPDVNGVADIESTHGYWGWYESSSYVNDYTKPRKGLFQSPGRAFLNLECAVPYQNTDTGGIHVHYARLYMGSPWIGELGVTGDSTWFSEHVRAESKRKSEKLRWERFSLPTAGVSLFNNGTWIQGVLSKPSSAWKPFPVWGAVRDSFRPVLVALETPQSVFFAGDTVTTRAIIVNDSDTYAPVSSPTLAVSLVTPSGQTTPLKKLSFPDIPYDDVRTTPVTFVVPGLGADPAPASIQLQLTDAAGRKVSTNTYPVRIVPRRWIAKGASPLSVATAGCLEDLLKILRATGCQLTELTAQAPSDVVLLGPGATNISETEARSSLKPGGRLIVLEQGKAARRFCPEVMKPAEADLPAPGGEFVEMLGWRDQRPLFDGLEAMDWKWWARGSDQPAYAASATHPLDITRPGVTPIGRFLAPHFYWSGDDLREVYQSKLSYPVFAVQREWGQLLVCDLAITPSLVDPRAAKTLVNLVTRAIDL